MKPQREPRSFLLFAIFVLLMLDTLFGFFMLQKVGQLATEVYELRQAVLQLAELLHGLRLGG